MQKKYPKQHHVPFSFSKLFLRENHSFLECSVHNPEVKYRS